MASKVIGGNKAGAYLSALSNKIADHATKVRVGFLEGATYPDGTPVAQVAFWNEYGTASSPPRPFFRNMVQVKSKTWGDGVATALKNNDNDVDKAFGLAGEGIKGQLVESINEFSSPSNAQKTIDKKGFDKALIDTGHMRNSVDFEVTDGD